MIYDKPKPEIIRRKSIFNRKFLKKLASRQDFRLTDSGVNVLEGIFRREMFEILESSKFFCEYSKKKLFTAREVRQGYQILNKDRLKKEKSI